jgi:magnesium transporter
MIRDKIDNFHYEDIKSENHPSIFFKHEDYDLFILRLPYLPSKGEIDYKSLSFVITDENYFYFNKDEKEFTDLKDIKGFYKYLDRYIDDVLKIVDNYALEIETVEDRIYEGKSIKEFNKQWFIHKTVLIRINRVLNKAVEVLNTLIRAYKNEDDYLERNFEDVFEHISRAYRNSGHLLEKLDSIYNFNLNQTNEQMNRIVYILTLLSGIFLPLNLIVGFFGMNTTSLPFTQTDGGTFNVIFILCFSMIFATLITLFMKRK